MRNLQHTLNTILKKPITQLTIISLCTIIITSSTLLFISDRGNILSYTNEQLQGWKNPSYQEMKTFINKDLTNYKTFKPNEYECKHFSIDLIQHAHEHGYRAGYVTLHNPHGEDHAIVCFHTTDKGRYYVEPQTDYLFNQTELNHMIANQYYHPQANNMLVLAQPFTTYLISWYMII